MQAKLGQLESTAVPTDFPSALSSDLMPHPALWAGGLLPGE